MPCGKLQEEPELEGMHSAADSCNNGGSQLFNPKLISVLEGDNYIALHSERTVTPLSLEREICSVTTLFSSWLFCE